MNNISTIKYNLLVNFKNIPGRYTSRKLVVIECDDWGDIGMPSKEVYCSLLKAGIPVDYSRFTRYDTLADKSDLEQLFEVLLSVRDHNGNPAVVTPVTNVANPDFKKIRESGFYGYFYMPFTETLERYGRHSDTFNTWEKGIELGIFVPEFHGREHIAVDFWLRKLREGDRKVMIAFNHEFVSVPLYDMSPVLTGFRPGFFFNDLEQTAFMEDSITDGVKLFNKIFGYIPGAFVPGNGIFHPIFEKVLSQTGVKYLNINHFNNVPDGKGKMKLIYIRNGKLSSSGLRYYTRNCAFEPTSRGYRGLDLTLRQMSAAFRWGRPANISTHRVNFVGGIDIKNREKGLGELTILLREIIKRWPDAEFMSTADMFKVLYPND